MTTTEEKQDLIDTIKRPVRHYRIQLWGYGGEVIYGRSSKEEYDYWETNIEDRRAYFKTPEEDSPFNHYMMDKDDVGGFDDVPESIRREGEYYDQDDIDHGNGVAFDNGNIQISEVESDEYQAAEIKEIVQQELEDFIDEHDAFVVVGESEAMSESFLFYAMSVEKGTFFDGRLTINGKIDLSKLRFECTEYPNGDVLVNHVFYENQEIDNDGGDINGKALYIELVAESPHDQ